MPSDLQAAGVVDSQHSSNDVSSESDVSGLKSGISVCRSYSNGGHESGMENASRNGLCQRCYKIDPTLLHSLKVRLPVQLGRVDELATRNCSFCQYFSRLLAVEPKVYGHITTGKKAYLDSTLGRGQPPLTLMVGDSERARIYVEGLIDENIHLTPPTICSSPLSPNLIRQWLTDCESQHANHCNTTSGSSNIDIYLIDVNRLCIIKASTSRRYIALSYVVGGQTGLQLTNANVLHLLEDNALTPERLSAINEKNIPQVVQDAIVLAKSLEEDCLWVDSLCIVQDNALTKYKQIMSMDIIYSRALLTIVSVSGDNSNCGLPGVRPDSRKPVNLSTDLKEYKILGQPPDIRRILDSSPYETRGWTFQERILSPRCLYLSNWQAYFQCKQGIQPEYCSITRKVSDDKIPQSSNEAYDVFKTQRRTMTKPLPPLHGIQQNFSSFRDSIHKMFLNYIDMVEQYTKRHLSFESDILNAFAGITSAIEQQYQTRFMHGMPIHALEFALLWAPIGPRKARGSVLSSAGEIMLPTWSWAACEGMIGYYAIDQKIFDPLLSCTSEMNLVGDEDVGSDSTLAFWATTADMSQFGFYQSPQSLSNRVTTMSLGATQCGLIFENDDVIRENLPDGGKKELVMISSSAVSCSLPPYHEHFRFLMPMYGEQGKLVLKMFSEKYPHEAERRYVVHVLLVQWKGDVAERVAVGLMHRDAWDEAQTTRKLIKLV